MKVLFLSNANLPDYMADTIMHGGRCLLGSDFVDYPRVNYMYKDYGDVGGLYGKGFSLFGLLGPDADVDRTEIIEKLKTKFYDVVIWGHIQRNQWYFGGITSTYPKNQLVAIDGEDSPHTFDLREHCMIFKRELCSEIDGYFPVHFGIPEEKILTERPAKSRFMSEYDPLVNRTYIYETEDEYYAAYACSYFAPTMRKMGHDCLRHYEILANWTLPYFRGIDGTPSSVMHRYPKKECDIVRRLIEYGPEGRDTAIDYYERVIEKVMKHTRENLTTTAVARYVLDTVKANQ